MSISYIIMMTSMTITMINVLDCLRYRQYCNVTVGTIVYTVLTLDPVRAPVACWGCVFIFCYSVYCIHLAGNSVSRTVQYIVSSYAMSPVTLVLKSQPIIASVMAGMAVYLHGRV